MTSKEIKSMTAAARRALRLAEKIENGHYAGEVHDCDTVLADIMGNIDPDSFCENIGMEILENFLACETDNAREMFAALFYDLTDVEFPEYLKMSVEEAREVLAGRKN